MAAEAETIDDDEAVPIIESITITNLDLPPSCIEVYPLDPRFFLVGTYLLDLENGKDQPSDSDTAPTSMAEPLRKGSLILGSICDQRTDVDQSVQPPIRRKTTIGDIHSIANFSFTPLQTLGTPYAVLDLHFSPHNPSICAVATSTGAVGFFLLDLKNRGHLASLKSIQIANPSVLVLSLAWNPSSSTPSTMAVSLSTGQIAIFDHLLPDTTLNIVQAHSVEAWTLAWSVLPSTNGATVLYSGGDDSALCRHSETLQIQDVQTDEEGAFNNAYEPLSRDTKTHDAGVTAILPVFMPGSNDKELLLTGSYDEYIRLLELAVAGRRSKILAEKRLGGGVWRLKLLSKSDSTLERETRMSVLASCMHAGVRILKISRAIEGTWTIVVSAKFEEHESMNYASDACTQLGGDVGNLIFLSTSFYDKKLCIWKANA